MYLLNNSQPSQVRLEIEGFSISVKLEKLRVSQSFVKTDPSHLRHHLTTKNLTENQVPGPD